MTKFSDPVVLIRPALPRDTADVVEFTKSIWDGHDYVGHVFPEWLDDPAGQLFAAEYAGRCVGTGKITRLAPAQWWLEGFRVDPNFQGMKIGSMIDARCNAWWDEHGDGLLRLLTSSKRAKVHHLSEARGFVKVGDVFGYSASALTGSADAFTLLTPPEAGEAVAFLNRHAPGRLMNLGWQFVSPNVDSLHALAEAGLAWWWRGRRGFLSAWENDSEDESGLTVGYEACGEEDRAAMLKDFRRLAGSRGMNIAGWMNVVDAKAIEALEEAGYEQAGDDSGFLYERGHP
ncbi:MAG: hypothetical protein HFACDABA_01614 [Anaerolineales bacterium]|nr:hypothetical protein [Anaerolineales bacterium]